METSSQTQLNPQSRFEKTHSKVVHQRNGSETLVLDLKSGHYFCLEGVAAPIWEGATNGDSVEEIVDALRVYEDCPETMADLVIDFLSKMVAEELLLALEGSTEKSGGTAVEAAGAFIAPSYTKFTDLAELLLADPIHEIDLASGADAS